MTAAPSPVVQPAPAADTLALRAEVLRDGRVPPAAMALPGDDVADTLHVVVRHVDHTVISTGNIRRETPPTALPVRFPDGEVWRIRGMATAPPHRGGGLGTAVLTALLDHAAAASPAGAVVWCHARLGARGLYERAGFVHHGDVFDIDDIGPHLVMWRTVP